MNPLPSRRGKKGFTLVELLVVIAIIGILAAMLLPVLNQGKARAKQAFCENNLSEMGIGFHSFGHDHNSKFPMGVSTNEGGAMEFVEAGYSAGPVFYFGFHVFQTVSNELVRPQLLFCPADMARSAAANFPDLQNQNVSYFFSANADFLNANSILIGDRSLATNSASQPTILQLGNGSRLRWTRELHLFKGNALFADGHVEEWNSPKLNSANDNFSPADLFMPSVPPTNSISYIGNSGSSSGGGGSSSGSGGSGGGSGNSTSVANPSSPNASAYANPNNSSPSPPPPSMNGNSGNSKPNPMVGRPSSPSPTNASSNNNGLNRNFGASSSENQPLVKQIAPVQTNTENHPVVASNDVQPAMSPADRKIAKVLRGVFEWSYLFLLLLLLLFLAYKLWQILRRDKNRRRKNELPPQS